MAFESKVEQLTESSATVLEDCALDNGAILAANTDMAYYPETAVNYRYVWPRDAAFVIYAANCLGMSPDIKVNFVDWLLSRAEGFSETGTIIKRYATNGRHDLAYGQHYQPDQAGAMLWALHETTEEPDRKVDQAIDLLATGLSRQWQGHHFNHPIDPSLSIQDLWEDQEIATGEESVFTYSLAAAIQGLESASLRLGDNAGAVSEDWAMAAESMRKILGNIDEKSHYPWKLPSSGEVRQIDASLSGLIWPFAAARGEVKASQDIATIDLIEEHLYKPGRGISRYIGDNYDGIMNDDSPLTEGAGTWPLLAFWYVLALKNSGMADKADEIYRETLEMLPNDYIPEQLLPTGRSGSPPRPLAWAHAMFIIASKELGYLDASTKR